uniref:Uncharacterized protein n=1 Tax=Strigamia maritima TaxID=126957 RepID=T1IN50_STRMM
MYLNTGRLTPLPFDPRLLKHATPFDINNPEEYVKELMGILHRTHRDMYRMIQRNYEKHDRIHCGKFIICEFQFDDLVMKRTHILSNADKVVTSGLAEKRDGPWQITKVHGGGAYELTKLENGAIEKSMGPPIKSLRTDSDSSDVNQGASTSAQADMAERQLNREQPGPSRNGNGQPPNRQNEPYVYPGPALGPTGPNFRFAAPMVPPRPAYPQVRPMMMSIRSHPDFHAIAMEYASHFQPAQQPDAYYNVGYAYDYSQPAQALQPVAPVQYAPSNIVDVQAEPVAAPASIIPTVNVAKLPSVEAKAEIDWGGPRTFD